MKTAIVHSVLAAALVAAGARASAAVNVVATTEDLASLVREVGGDRVQVDALARGYQDPHFAEAKPSFILKLNKADLLVLVGRELEVAWLPALINQSRNPRVQPGAPGHLDASAGARILEIPTGPITRAMGDVHPSGNPHYWLDPGNGRRMAQSIRDRLSQLRPGDAPYFAARYADFDQRLSAAEARWDALMKPYRGLDVVTYHRSWPNFAERFGLEVLGYVEPRPGIPPSPSHTIQLIQQMKQKNVKLLLVEPYFDLKTPSSVARESGAKVVVLLPSVGGEKEVTDYLALFDHNLDKLLAAIKETGAR
jgi:zinc/manganese transport system substrate-binding protein